MPPSSQFCNHEFTIVKLRKLSTIHLKLAATIKIINRTFSIALMLYFFVFFCWFCILLFIITKSTTSAIFHAFFLPRFFINLTLDGLMLSSLKSANDSAREAKRTREILFKMRNECWNDVIYKELGSFIEQVQFTPTHYSCGLFVFNWKFVFNVSLKFNLKKR